MSDFPEDVQYTAEHEWIRRDGAVVRVGITAYAQQALGDVVYVTLPQVGAEAQAGQAVGEVESTKSVSDIYAPVSGRVVARNDGLDTQPELVNSDPYGEGWMLEIEVADTASLDGLMDADAYRQTVQSA
ncbi:MAG: glycine cleavage system protein GcvH [Actinomycetes bacterium]